MDVFPVSGTQQRQPIQVQFRKVGQIKSIKNIGLLFGYCQGSIYHHFSIILQNSFHSRFPPASLITRGITRDIAYKCIAAYVRIVHPCVKKHAYMFVRHRI